MVYTITTMKAIELAKIASKKTPCSEMMQDCFYQVFVDLIREIENDRSDEC